MGTFRKIPSFVFGVLTLTFSSSVFGQWVQTAGPEGGTASCLAVCGKNLFAGTGNGVSISTDNGSSWTSVNSGLTNTNANAIAVIDSNIFVLTDSGVFHTTNNGQNWIKISTGFPTNPVRFLAANTTDLFAANDFEILHSINFGKSWDSINLPPITDYYITALAVNGTGILFGTDGGAFLSTDNGSHWNGLGGGITSAGALIGTNIFVGGEINYVEGGNIYRSTDGGDAFTNPINLPQQVFVRAFGNIGAIVFAGTEGKGAFISTDQGVTWNPTDKSLTASSIFTFTQIGTSFFAGTEGGVFRSTDSGKVWTQINSGLRSANVTAFASIGKNLFVGTDGNGVFLTTNGGSNWTAIDNNNENKDVADLVASDTNLFTAGPVGVFRSTNTGANWDIVDSSGLPFYTLAVIGTTLFDGSGFEHEGGVYYGGVDKSTDGGSSWSGAGIGDEDIEWLVTGGGLLCASGSSAVISTDLGATWNSPIWNAPFYATIISLAKLDTNILAGTDEGLFISKNHGASWDPIGKGLPNTQNNPIYSILIINGNIFAASYGAGVFRSTDNGLTWTSINDGLTNLITYALFTDGVSLFLGIDGAGVWRRPLSDFGISSVSQGIPIKNSISNYPNPFSQSTNVTFTTEEPGFGNVTILNLLGQQVAQLFDGELDAGEHSFVWDAKDIPAGTYFCIVRMNDNEQQVPMVLSR